VADSQIMKAWWTASLAGVLVNFFYGVVVRLEDFGRAGFACFFVFVACFSFIVIPMF